MKDLLEMTEQEVAEMTDEQIFEELDRIGAKFEAIREDIRVLYEDQESKKKANFSI